MGTSGKLIVLVTDLSLQWIQDAPTASQCPLPCKTSCGCRWAWSRGWVSIQHGSLSADSIPSAEDVTAPSFLFQERRGHHRYRAGEGIGHPAGQSDRGAEGGGAGSLWVRLKGSLCGCKGAGRAQGGSAGPQGSWELPLGFQQPLRSSQWEDSELLVAHSQSGAHSKGRHCHSSLASKIHRD